MAAGRPEPHFGAVAEEFQRFWVEQSRALSRKSSGGEFVLATESGHHLYEDSPDLVVESVRSVVNRIRDESATE
jgi:hypothetical protein